MSVFDFCPKGWKPNSPKLYLKFQCNIAFTFEGNANVMLLRHIGMLVNAIYNELEKPSFVLLLFFNLISCIYCTILFFKLIFFVYYTILFFMLYFFLWCVALSDIKSISHIFFLK